MRKAGYDHASAVSGNGLPKRRAVLLLYDLALAMYVLGIRIYSLCNAKAAQWIRGRRNWEERYEAQLKPAEDRIWVHCASVGEFEQAKPLIEAIRKQYAGYKIVLSFFSPSGYDACKDTPLADYVFYLPTDGKHNASTFISLVEPEMVIFVKYEFWYHYLAFLKKRHIPAILVSGAFRQEQPFFKWYGGLFRDLLSCFSFFFLQDELSKQAIHEIGFDDNVVISGDTRYDRVATIASNITPVAAIEKFKNGYKILIAGSSWPADEVVLKDSMEVLPANWKLIVAPHEVDAGHIRKIQELFGNETILFSELDAETGGANKKILIIDNIGMLSRLFACGDIAFIGGGFYKGGIHNILEPAVFGLPVVFGPTYKKFVEAKKLVALKLVFPVSDATECKVILEKLVTDDVYYNTIRVALKSYMREHTGATRSIMEVISAKKWLG